MNSLSETGIDSLHALRAFGNSGERSAFAFLTSIEKVVASSTGFSIELVKVLALVAAVIFEKSLINKL
jgi:hypothetical protein